MMQFNFFLKLLKDSFLDLLPIFLVIVFFQLAIIQHIPDNWISTSIGLIIVGFGLALFLQGLEIGIFPLGENLSRDFARSKWIGWIFLFGFLIGFGTTIAEPVLLVVASKAQVISDGRIDETILRLVVAFSVGFALVIGIFRIIKGHPIHYYIIAGYIIVIIVTSFSPNEIIGLSYDLGGVTTSTVTVPIIASIGIGLSSAIKGRNPVIDGFGLIAFAALTPMIFVQIYGILVYNFFDIEDVSTIISQSSNKIILDDFISIISSIMYGIFGVIKDILPIIISKMCYFILANVVFYFSKWDIDVALLY